MTSPGNARNTHRPIGVPKWFLPALSITSFARWIVLTAFAISGAVSLALEGIWRRVWVLILGPTVYLIELFRAGPSDLRRWLGEGKILTDDRPILEYFLSQSREPLDLKALRGDIGPYIEP